MACSKKRPSSAERSERDNSRIFTPSQASRSFSLSFVDWFSFAGLYVPYFLGLALACSIALLLPPMPIPKPPTSVPSVADMMSAAEDVLASAMAAPARASSAMDEAGRTAVLLYTQLMSTGAHIWHRWYAYAVLAFCLYYMLSAQPPVYIMDFAVYEAPASWRVTRAQLVEIMRRTGVYSQDSLEFMAKLLAKSGTGDATHWPPGTLRLLTEIDPATGQHWTSADRSIEAARGVAETVLCSVFAEALARSGKKARDVDFLIVNCSLFCPTPSLCAIVAQKFGLKPTCRTYNLGGMGCSASVISLDLAKQLLQGRPNSIAVVLSTEEISQQLYMGNERGHLLQNTLFRVGGAGILLSNKPVDGFRAKYKLLHTVRVQDNSATAHNVVYQCSDAQGKQGIFLGKEITRVAGKALQANLTAVGHVILPIRELLYFGATIAQRACLSTMNGWGDALGLATLPFARGSASAEDMAVGAALAASGAPPPSPAATPRGGAASASASAGASAPAPASKASEGATARPGRYLVPEIYVPDFKRGVQHFCIHAGGRAVIDGIEQNLKLERWRTAPSRATLYHWGNTSSSSIWYELRYCEMENDKGSAAPLPPPAPAAGASASAPAPAPAPAPEPAPAPRKNKRSGSAGKGGGAGSSGSSSSSGSSAAAAGSGGATSGAGAAPAPPKNVSDDADPDAEAAAAGWDINSKWLLPDYRGRQVRRGDRILQLAFGSGFKCNSSLLLRLR